MLFLPIATIATMTMRANISPPPMRSQRSMASPPSPVVEVDVDPPPPGGGGSMLRGVGVGVAVGGYSPSPTGGSGNSRVPEGSRQVRLWCRVMGW